MKNRNKYSFIGKCLAISAFLFTMLIACNAQAVGLGISSGTLSNDQLTRGSVFKETIYINRSDTSDTLKASVTTNIPGADSWIKIENGNSFELKNGVISTPMVVSVTVPDDAEYKEYKGKIDITATPSGLEGTIAIASGFSVIVDLKVIEKKVNSFLLQNVKAQQAIEGKNIVLDLVIKNTGNIPTSPTRAVLDIYDAAKKEVMTTKDNIREIEKVQPFETGSVKAEFDSNGVSANNYWGKLKVYNGDELVGEYDVGITILPKEAKSSIEKEGLLGKILASIDTSMLIIIGLALLLLILLIIIKRKSKKDSKKTKSNK